ncbi:hypothetical protein BJ912DRAFT_1066388 [Pholiota molesta]|nr:hypothetical protein BJ912DRAFT_1066388 [Pholiota molesta]
MHKVVLITGANSGVGFELVRLIAEKGHIVYLGARNEESGKQAVETLHSEGLTTVKPVLIDITQPSSIKSAKEAIETAEGRLDVLVNNAGVGMVGESQDAISPNMDVVRKIMETNFYGAIETTVAFLPLLRKSTEKSPVIVNVASSASKVALNSYTIALALELKDEGFKVNSVTPGVTATKMTHNHGQPVRDGGVAMLPWALLGSDGPTGKFFGPDGQELPW